MRRARGLVGVLSAGLILILGGEAAGAPPGAGAAADRGALLEDWPCPGCLTAVPPGGAEAAADAGAGRPLLAALHGDDAAVRRMLRTFRKAADDAGVILVALRCPKAEGCRTGSWWQWKSTSEHDPAWLGKQLDAVAARFPVDASRIYAVGYSGGGTYLGWYGPEHPERFAAIAHVAGGMPWGTPCPVCKVPVSFVLGTTDPMLVPYTRPLKEFYERCGGHEVIWETLPGVTHESILTVMEAGRAKSVLGWLLQHRAECSAAGSAAVADAGADVEAGVDDGGAVIAEPPDAGAGITPAVAPVVPRVDPRPPPGCACDLGPDRGRGAPLAVVVAGALAALRRRSRRARS